MASHKDVCRNCELQPQQCVHEGVWQELLAILADVLDVPEEELQRALHADARNQTMEVRPESMEHSDSSNKNGQPVQVMVKYRVGVVVENNVVESHRERVIKLQMANVSKSSSRSDVDVVAAVVVGGE